MIRMELDEYLERIAWHSESLRYQGPWFYEVVQPWIEKVAPVKTVEYGIDCWKRLGSKGLLVDINACYYRWLRQRNMEWTGPALDNALVDLYGYSAMYCVCLAVERNMSPGIGRIGTDFSSANEPWELNECLITHVWEKSHPNIRELSASRLVATALAKTAWENHHS